MFTLSYEKVLHVYCLNSVSSGHAQREWWPFANLQQCTLKAFSFKNQLLLALKKWQEGYFKSGVFLHFGHIF